MSSSELSSRTRQSELREQVGLLEGRDVGDRAPPGEREYLDRMGGVRAVVARAVHAEAELATDPKRHPLPPARRGDSGRGEEGADVVAAAVPTRPRRHGQ